MSLVSLTKDGRRALDSSLALWDAESCTILRSFATPASHGLQVKLSADGSRAISSGVKPLTVWDVEQGSILQVIDNGPIHPTAVDLSADGNRALMLSVEGEHIALLDFGLNQAGELEWQPGRLMSAVLSPDGRRLIAGTDIRSGGQGWQHPAPSYLLIWDLDQTQAPPRRMDGAGGGITRIRLNADGSRAVTCGLDCAVIYWDLETGEILQRLAGHKEWLWAVALSPDERYAVSGGADRKIILWDLQEGKAVNSLELNSPIKEIEWAGNRIAAVSRGLNFLELEP